MTGPDEARDARLAALAAECGARPSPARLEAIRAAVLARGAPLLAARRARRARWRRAGGAAGLAMAAVLASLLVRPGDPAGAEALVTSDLPERELRSRVAGTAETRVLLLEALEER